MLVQVGLGMTGWQSSKVAYIIWTIGAIWALLALLTWDSIDRRFTRKVTSFVKRQFRGEPVPSILNIVDSATRRSPEERSRAYKMRVFEELRKPELAALRFVFSSGPVSPDLVREHVISQGLDWSTDILPRLGGLFIAHDFNGKFSVEQEHLQFLRDMFK